MNWVKFCLFFFITLSFGALHAQINTDRPDQTESSQTVPKHTLQLESGIRIGDEGKHQTYAQQMLLPTNLFRLGIAQKLELRILSQYETAHFQNFKAAGISDLELGVKIQMLESKDQKTQIAMLSHLILPTGTYEVSNQKFGSSTRVCISHALGSLWQIGYNLGYDYHGKARGDLTYSFSVGYIVNDRVGFYFEPYGEWLNFEKWRMNGDAGFTFLVSDNLQLDVSLGTGINHKMNFISAGCSWLMK